MLNKRTTLGAGVTLIAMLMLMGCGAKEQKNFKVELEENATTGYRWFYEIADETVVQCVEDETVEGDKDKAGAPGTRVFEFSGMKEGETTITFTYKRDWEGGETADTKEITVEVDEEGNMQEK